jgi:hypothetical protein
MLMMKPGAQKAHWKPASSTTACCTGWSWSPLASPSIVTTSRPRTWWVSIEQRVAGHPVDQHRAGAAIGPVAPDLGARQPQLVAERRRQRLLLHHVDAAILPVHPQASPAARPSPPPRAILGHARVPEEVRSRRHGRPRRDHTLDEGAPATARSTYALMSEISMERFPPSVGVLHPRGRCARGGLREAGEGARVRAAARPERSRRSPGPAWFVRFPRRGPVPSDRRAAGAAARLPAPGGCIAASSSPKPCVKKSKAWLVREDRGAPQSSRGREPSAAGGADLFGIPWGRIRTARDSCQPGTGPRRVGRRRRPDRRAAGWGLPAAARGWRMAATPRGERPFESFKAARSPLYCGVR